MGGINGAFLTLRIPEELNHRLEEIASLKPDRSKADIAREFLRAGVNRQRKPCDTEHHIEHRRAS